MPYLDEFDEPLGREGTVQAAEEGKNDKMQVRNWEEGTSATLRSTRSSCVVSSCSPIGSSHASWLFHPISIEISMDKPGKLLSIHRPGPEASLASSQCLLLSSGVVDLDWQVDHLYITYPVAFSISSFVLWPVVTGGRGIGLFFFELFAIFRRPL